MSTPYPDVSQVLRGETLLKEDDTWIRLIHEKQHLAESLADVNFYSVLEIGCGTGIYAGILSRMYSPLDYCGVDANPEALVIARRRNPDLTFIESDFRRFPGDVRFRVVCAHAFLKHFSLADWLDLFPKFLAIGEIAQFDMQTAAETINDGSPSFGNNLWVADDLFSRTLAASGHHIISSEVAYEHNDRRATIFLTSRV